MNWRRLYFFFLSKCEYTVDNKNDCMWNFNTVFHKSIARLQAVESMIATFCMQITLVHRFFFHVSASHVIVCVANICYFFKIQSAPSHVICSNVGFRRVKYDGFQNDIQFNRKNNYKAMSSRTEVWLLNVRAIFISDRIIVLSARVKYFHKFHFFLREFP